MLILQQPSSAPQCPHADAAGLPPGYVTMSVAALISLSKASDSASPSDSSKHVAGQAGGEGVNVTLRLVNAPADGQTLSQEWLAFAYDALGSQTLLPRIEDALASQGAWPMRAHAHARVRASRYTCSSAHQSNADRQPE